MLLLYIGHMHLLQTTSLAPSLPYLFGSIAGILLFFGLWTPLAGIAIAAVEAWTFFASLENPLIATMLACLGATLAMIGPGVWSIDAQLYGRKHIQPSRH
jgi:uncharacterized membrane protein YphA (DoxX/SURF4 family)